MTFEQRRNVAQQQEGNSAQWVALSSACEQGRGQPALPGRRFMTWRAAQWALIDWPAFYACTKLHSALGYVSTNASNE